MGKTSVLKQLEHVTAAGSQGYVPLFWDFQGADVPEELHLSFHDALLDAEERLGELGVEVSAMDPADLFSSLGRVRRRVRSTGRRLLLLCDEVEELIELQAQDRSLLRKLRRALQSGEEVRAVLASTIRLWALAEQREDTSPFLHGFAPPIYLPPLTEAEGRALLRQEQLPAAERPELSATVVERLGLSCGHHPYLLQLVGKRYLELGEVEEALERVASDEMVSHFFAVDFEMLSPVERSILRAIGERPARSSGALEKSLGLESSQLRGGLQRLEGLGFLRRDPNRELVLANQFFRRWLRGIPEPAPAGESQETAPAASATAFSQRLTELLTDLDRPPGQGEKPTPPELLETVYDELRALAHRYMSRERIGHTLQPTALVHEAYLRLVDQSRVDWQGRTHFFALSAQMMRRILIDHARGRKRAKRGGNWLRISWAEDFLAAPKDGLSDEQLMDLDRALKELAQVSERQAKIVELRYFAGLSVEEAAQFLGVSKRTAESDWTRAREWLAARLSWSRGD
jgi:RNA polymerase sigma factor (TIGR02999 family)